MDEINELISRGVKNIIPGKVELEKLLKQNKTLNIYLGIDPTSTSIHLGHALALRKLQLFANLGHNVTFLIGDFTALVGDTSDKDSERPILSPEEIEENFKTYKNQAEKLVDFSKIKIKNNSEWLSNLSYSDVFKIKQQFSLNDFISRELIKKRLNEEKRVRLDETEYPIMQGYDSYHMDTDIQIGGADQLFNMQAGRTLQKNFRKKESYIMWTEYLMGTDGRKMSKSWGNAIWLTDSPFEMFRKIMAINDDQIKNYYLLGTNTAMDELPNDDEISKNPLDTKKKLAEIIVSELHSQTDAKKATEEFEKVIQKGGTPSNIAEHNLNKGDLIDIEFLVNNNFASSKSEAKRLFEQNGISLDDKKIKSGEKVNKNSLLRIGKKVVKLSIN